jgi:hypothetical protein
VGGARWENGDGVKYGIQTLGEKTIGALAVGVKEKSIGEIVWR